MLFKKNKLSFQTFRFSIEFNFCIEQYTVRMIDICGREKQSGAKGKFT